MALGDLVVAAPGNGPVEAVMEEVEVPTGTQSSIIQLAVGCRYGCLQGTDGHQLNR